MPPLDPEGSRGERACTSGPQRQRQASVTGLHQLGGQSQDLAGGGLAALPSLCLWLRLPSLPGRFPFSCRSLCTLRSLLMGQSLPEPSRSAPSLPVLSQPRVLSRFEQGSRTECVQLSVLPECAGKTLHPNPGLSLFCVDHRPGTSPLCFLICRMALAAPNSQGSLED